MTKHHALLEGLRVLDLTDEKGLFCGKVLGDFGADVIKIEKPGATPPGTSALSTRISPTRRRACSGSPPTPVKGASL